MQNENKRTSGAKFLFPLLVMLVNPSIRLVDIFPDLIVCFILAGSLSFYADRAPHFAEAKDRLIKLGWLSVLRIPAFAIAATVKSANVADNDITVLFTFLFAICEAYLLISAVNQLFSGFFYLGMRSDGRALAPFSIGKNKTMRPERLKNLAFAFIIFKAVASALPEMLLLSRTDEIGATTKLFNFRALYPYFVVVLVPLVLVLGILLARLFARYIKTVYRDGLLVSEADALLNDAMRAELEKNRKIKHLCKILTLIFAAAVLSVDIRLGEFSMIDLCPDFIPALIMFIAAFMLTRESKKELFSLVALSAYGIFSALSYFVEFAFLDGYGFSALEKNASAIELYRGVLLTSSLALLALFFATAAIAYTISLLLKRCGISEIDTEAIEFSKRKRAEITLRIAIFSLLTLTLGVVKFLYILFNYYTQSILVATDTGANTVAAGLIPWFGTLVFAVWIAFAVYTYFFTEHLKEEIRLKLS